MRPLIPLLAAAATVLSTVPADAGPGDQLFKLPPSDGAEFESFGSSVAVSGTTAIAGDRLTQLLVEAVNALPTEKDFELVALRSELDADISSLQTESGSLRVRLNSLEQLVKRVASTQQ